MFNVYCLVDSDFSIGMNLAKSDEEYWYAEEYAQTQHDMSYLHNMNLYDDYAAQYPGLFFELQPSDQHLKYPGKNFAKK